jgi:hypothetical protein
VQTTHYLSIIGVANSVVNITLRAAVPEHPDGTGRFFTSGFPPLLRVPINAGEACIDLCVDPSGNSVPCEEGCTSCSAPDACHASWCDAVTRLCTSAPIDCDDGDPCTSDGCDAVTGCQHAPVGCDDGDPCTADSCGPNGCEHTALTDDTDGDRINDCQDLCPADACNICDEELDVKPTANPSIVNLASPYATPVALFGSADLDVTLLDLASLSFDAVHTAEVKLKPNGQPLLHYHDIDGDGLLDVEISFVTDGVALACISRGVLVGAVEGCSAGLRATHDTASDAISVFNASTACLD